MKRVIALVLAMVFMTVTVGCGNTQSSDVEIDYGKSSVYTEADMDAAIQLIQKEFATWKGCELHKIAYSSDEECCGAEFVQWMNELQEGMDGTETFSQSIMFRSDFHSPKEGGGAWEADQEYTDWQWWLGRSEGGQWKLMTWGY